jgi:hypothetical protein
MLSFVDDFGEGIPSATDKDHPDLQSVGHTISSRTRAKTFCSSSEAVFVGLGISAGCSQ